MTAIAVAGTRRSMKELVDGTIRVQIDIDPPDRAAFLRLFPNIDMPVALAPLVPNTHPPRTADSGPAAGGREDAGEGEGKSRTEWDRPDAVIPYDPNNGLPERSPPNELARKLHVDGYFRNPKLWLAMHDSGIYTTQDHHKWLMTRRCYIPKHDIVCFGDECVHHCNAASAIDGGKRQPEAPQKPLHYYGLKLCHAHHAWAHGKDATREDKEYLLEYAVALTADQMKVQMKRVLNIHSLRDITSDLLGRFEMMAGL